MSSVFESEEQASQIAPIVLMPLILFGGQFANPEAIPKWIGWIQYISPIRYGLEALVVNEFDNRIYNTTLIMRNAMNNMTRSFPTGIIPPKDIP
jgi:ABC-type multidrug transport system permease subunit